jgi:5-methylcytosine-specific restriction protein A
MGFNIHILSVRNRSTNLPGHAALAASFNPPMSQPAEPLVLGAGGIDECKIDCRALLLAAMTPRNLAPAQTMHWRDFYGLQSRRRRRAHQLRMEPLCAACLKAGKVTPATIADHIEPHGGDYTKFVLGKLQSLCEPCHQPKWAADKRGYSSDIGDDGHPLDVRHSFNRLRVTRAKDD